jgi:dihydropteroate synthase
MGIVNVTPDSFSDGGDCLDPRLAVERAEKLIDDGADIIDVGAESTRPGSAEVGEDEEWRRLEPVLKGLGRVAGRVILSVDTRKPRIMRRALDLGVRMINDVEGGRAASELEFLGKIAGLHYLAMHMHGRPGTMQSLPLKAFEVVEAVGRFFETSHNCLMGFGFSSERIWLDPGVGFGKTDAANLRLMGSMAAFAGRYQLAIGVSRKSWMGRTLNIVEPRARDEASKMIELAMMWSGVRLIRTHDVARLARLRALVAADD